jgi:hypothetical protein
MQEAKTTPPPLSGTKTAAKPAWTRPKMTELSIPQDTLSSAGSNADWIPEPTV